MIFASTEKRATRRRGYYLAAGVGFGRTHSHNPILSALRYNNAYAAEHPDHYEIGVHTAAEWLAYSEDCYTGPAEHLVHARKVLNRLASTSDGGRVGPSSVAAPSGSVTDRGE